MKTDLQSPEPDPAATHDGALDTSALIAAAEVSFQSGDHARAMASLENGLCAKPEDFDLLMFLGNVRYHAKDLPGAAACFTRAARQRPDAVNAHLSRASAAIEGGDFLESEGAVRVALALEPDNLTGLKLLARLSLTAERFKETGLICEAILKLHSEDTDAWLALGRCRYELGDLPGAAQAFEEVLCLDPSNGTAGDNLTHVRKKQGNTAPADFPVPSSDLRYRVVSTEHSEEQYLKNGLTSTSTITEYWNRYGTGSPARILDFGCGCGRVLRHLLKSPVFHGARFDGCDIDAPAIAWCRGNLPGDYYESSQYPPLKYPDRSFDLIYGLSVFTHIDLDSQRSWLNELARVLSDDGILLLSVNGTGVWNYYQSTTHGNPDELREKGFVFVKNIADGVLPEWYQTSFNSVENIRREFAEHFEILQHASQGLGGFQDLLVLRKRGRPPTQTPPPPPATTHEKNPESAPGGVVFTGNWEQ